MENIKIAIAANGTTTLATAGKYCDRNVDVEVNVAGGGSGVEIEPIVLSGNQPYSCSGAIASAFIKNFGDKVSTNNIRTAANNMFQYYENETIPFDINIDTTTSSMSMNSMFSNCEKLRELPRINYAYPSAMSGFCENCYNLRNIPDDYFDVFNFSRMQTYTSANFGGIFTVCYSLRKIPDSLLRNLWGIQTVMSYVPYSSLISFCYAIDECNGLPIQQSKLNNNVLSSTVNYACRLKNFTFEINEDGSAKTATWKSQTFDFSQCTGWINTSYSDAFAKYNSGITADKEVKDDATYQALKNDPDWFTCDINYSRYNHDSAVNTINSLPDCSAYLTANGGTNTIKFKGQSGALTDGGAINTLTEEEIAVATAKGWSVALV